MNPSHHKPIQDIVQAQQQFFRTGTTKTAAFRLGKLQLLEQMLRQHENDIEEALHADLRKHPQEVYMTELGPVYEEIRTQQRMLRKWMKPRKVPSPLYIMPSSSYIYPEPVGNVFIISPWNYPILLTYRVAAGAIAAGNTLLIKHSEHAPHTSALMAQLIQRHFPEEYMHVMEGVGEEVIPPLLDQFYFGKIFFTGSTMVGKKIMQMAAKHLSPVCLELGGKTPCIVDDTANLTLAAKRIVWGKMLNAGQSCVAPDYLLVNERVKDTLIDAIRDEIHRCFGEDMRHNKDYGRIINEHRYRHLKSLMQSGDIIMGGSTDDADLFMELTLLGKVPADAPIMREEIFGPLMPVFTYKEKEEVLKLIDKNPHPLALYLFSTDKTTQDFFLDRVSFGGGCINETIFQLGNPHIPFSGVGPSGMGGYLGKYSFDAFTHYKGVVKKWNFPEVFFRFPPYNSTKARLWRLFIGRK